MIHDEVMPEMSRLSNLADKLKSKVDSTAMGKKHDAAVNDLHAAHASMMDWMMTFGERFDSDEILNGKPLTQKKQEWLDEEEKKIKALQHQINQSIENAEALLDKPWNLHLGGF